MHSFICQIRAYRDLNEIRCSEAYVFPCDWNISVNVFAMVFLIKGLVGARFLSQLLEYRIYVR